MRATEALIAAKLKHKRAWAEQLLTGKVRFPEFAGQAWQEIRLSEVLRESRVPAKTSHSSTRLTVRLHTEGVEARKDRGTEAEEATMYYERRAGQFIYGKQNLYRGAVGLVPEALDGYSSLQDVPAFDWLPGYSPTYFVYYASQKPFYEGLERLATGTGSKRIHPAAFLSVRQRIPSLAEQRKIADVLGRMDEEIALRRPQLSALKAQKQGLMQKYSPGKCGSAAAHEQHCLRQQNRPLPPHPLRPQDHRHHGRAEPERHGSRPRDADEAAIERIVRKRAVWIIRQQKFFAQFLPKTPPRAYVSGETHLYLGRKYRLRVRGAEREEVKLQRGYLYVYTSHPRDAEQVKGLLHDWYEAHARVRFAERLAVCLKTTAGRNIAPPRLEVRRMSKRWGSCRASGILALNLDLIRAPRACIDYVILHELCHLHHPNHSPRFYQLLTDVLPDWKAAKLRLEQTLS